MSISLQTCSLSLNCHPVSLFLSPLSPCWTPRPPPVYVSNLECESKNQDALSVPARSDDQMKADWFRIEDSNGYEEFIGSCGKDAVSSQMGNHRHQHCAAASSEGKVSDLGEKSLLFGREKSFLGEKKSLVWERKVFFRREKVFCLGKKSLF